jgi:hypothetical protein
MACRSIWAKFRELPDLAELEAFEPQAVIVDEAIADDLGIFDF